MREFILGFVCGMVFLIILIPIFSRWLMKWFIKKKMNTMTTAITGNLMNLGGEFQKMQNGGQENKTSSESIERSDIGSERTPNDSSETDS